MRSESDRAPGTGGASKILRVLDHPRVRPVVYQALLATGVGIAAWYFTSNAAENLWQRRIASGFGFLAHEAGFEVGESAFLSYDSTDTYLRAIAVGFFNTFRVSVLAIIFSTVLGGFIGLTRLSPNWLLAKLAAAYIEMIRNIPLVVQLFFWYAVITESLPAPADALSAAPAGISGPQRFWLFRRRFALPRIRRALARPLALHCRVHGGNRPRRNRRSGAWPVRGGVLARAQPPPSHALYRSTAGPASDCPPCHQSVFELH